MKVKFELTSAFIAKRIQEQRYYIGSLEHAQIELQRKLALRDSAFNRLAYFLNLESQPGPTQTTIEI